MSRIASYITGLTNKVEELIDIVNHRMELIEDINILDIATYDPTDVSADAFDRANHHGVVGIDAVAGLRSAINYIVPLGHTMIWHMGRPNIPSGYVPRDGQLLNRADYPLMWTKIQASGRLIDEEEWQQNPAKRAGYFSNGDGETTFRMQDANGLQEGSFKAVYERGSYGHGFDEGMTHGDAIRNIYGTLDVSSYDGSHTPTGPFRKLTNGHISAGVSQVAAWPRVFEFDASRVVPTTDPTTGENRTIALIGVSIMKIAAGILPNEGGDSLVSGIASTLTNNIFLGNQHINGKLVAEGEVELSNPNPIHPEKFMTGSGWRDFNVAGEVVSISGASASFGDIPEWATHIELMIVDLVSSTGSHVNVAAMSNGVTIETGYNVAMSSIGASSVATSNITNRFRMYRNQTGNSSFKFALTRFDETTWLLQGSGRYASSGTSHSNGTLTTNLPIDSIIFSLSDGTITSGKAKLTYR